jgi:hypothetical protein
VYMKFVTKLVTLFVTQLLNNFEMLPNDFLKQTLKIRKAMRMMEQQKIQSPYFSELLDELIT